MNGNVNGLPESGPDSSPSLNMEHVQSCNQLLRNRLLDIIAKQEQKDGTIDYPFYLADLKSVRHEYQTWQRLFPRVQVFYAVKCCNETPFLGQLIDMNSSFDCASQREIETLLNLGVDASRIIFANTIKSVTAIKYAAKHGVSLMTFDNDYELDKIKTHFPKARLVLRFRCKKSEHIRYQFGMKFGCPLTKVEKLLQKAKSDDLNVVGVSFHVGCNTENGLPYVEAIRDAYTVFTLANKAGFNFTLLDIGGGFRGYHAPHLSFEKTAEQVNAALDEYFPRESDIRILAEPGTRLATSSYTWAVKVIGKVSNEDLDEGSVRKNSELIKIKPRFVYYVNDGVFGTMTFNKQEVPKMKPLGHKDECPCVRYSSVVFGPTCEPSDVIYTDIMLPELNIGDWLYLENAGAYSLAVQRYFNMMPQAKCFYVDED